MGGGKEMTTQLRSPSLIISASCHRSGSTWIQRIINAATDILVWGEPYPLIESLAYLYNSFIESDLVRSQEAHNFFSQNQDPKVWIANMNPPLDNIRKGLLALLSEFYNTPLPPGKTKYGWKEVRYGRYELEFLWSLFPDLRVILLVRNPIDVVQSLKNLGWISLWEDTKNLETICLRWSQNTRDYLALQGHPNVFFIRYEDVLTRIEELLAFVNGRFNDAVKEALYAKTGAAEGQEMLSREEVQLILKICANEMMALGYIQAAKPPYIISDMLNDEVMKLPLIKQLQNLQYEKRALRTRLNQAEAEQTTLAQKIQILQAKLLEKGQAVERLQSELAELEGEREQLQQEVVRREQSIQELQAKLLEKGQAVERLQSELAELKGEREQLQQEVVRREQSIQELQAKLLEKEQNLQARQQLLDAIYTSRGFKVLAKIWELRAAWRGGPRVFARFIIRQIYRRLPKRLQQVLWKVYILFQKSGNVHIKQENPHVQASEDKSYCQTPQYGIGIPGLVSVVLPVYNQATLLRDAIISVLNQTYDNFELIIVNDGSTDKVETVLDEFVNHPKVRILAHKQNRGLPQALNTGFSYARGEYWTWTSADNIMMPEQLEKHVAFLRSHPEVVMVYSDYLAIDDRGQPLQDPRFRPHNRETPFSPVIRLPRSTERLNIVKDNFIGPCFMYRAWVGKVIGPYDPQFFGAEDYDYWMRINSHFRISHLGTDEVLYQYRVHDNTLNARAAELGIFERVEKLMQFAQERDKFYASPFEVCVDPHLYEELKEVIQCQPLPIVLQGTLGRTKRLILLSDREESLSWIKSLEHDAWNFVILLLRGEGERVYDITPDLWQRIDLCFAENTLALKRANMASGRSVFLIQTTNQLLKIAKAAANEAIFRRVQGREKYA
jgi:glycosyltransferase involved in cell wall biosynthesis